MREKDWLRDYGPILLTGVVVGIAALVLTAAGNPKNMGFCIACFERDIAGALGLHSASKVQYIRPEIIGIVLGSLLAALAAKEFRAKAGSSPGRAWRPGRGGPLPQDRLYSKNSSSEAGASAPEASSSSMEGSSKPASASLMV